MPKTCCLSLLPEFSHCYDVRRHEIVHIAYISYSEHVSLLELSCHPMCRDFHLSHLLVFFIHTGIQLSRSDRLVQVGHGA